MARDLPPGFVVVDEEEDKNEGLPPGFVMAQPTQPAAQGAPVEGRALNMLANGLTLGLAPRIAAAWETGAVSGPEYEAAKKAQWAKDDAYRAANPWTSMALEVGGSLPTMFIPGLGAGRLAQAANQGLNATQNLSRGARVARALTLPGSAVASVGHEAGMLGAKTAALVGANASREDTAGGRIGEGLSHAPLGYGFGRAADYLLRPAVAGAEHLRDAAVHGGNAELGALMSVRRGLERDRTTPQAVREALLPDMGRANAPPRAVETAISTHAERLAAGQTDHAARQAAQNAYVAAARADGSTLGTDALRKQARRALDRFANDNRVPLSVDEAVRLTGGSGQNSQWVRRVAANTPGSGRDDLTNAVMARQESIIPTARGQVEESLGHGDWLRAKDRLVSSNKELENSIYDVARANEQPFDLTPVLEAFNRTQPFAAGKTQSLTQEALRIMRGVPDMATGQYPRHTLNTYIQARGQLNDLIDEAMRENAATGVKSHTSASRQLVDLKRRMDAIVRRENPLWAEANDTARGLRGIENAMDDGMRVKIGGNDNTSARVLRDVEDLRQRISTLERNTRRTSVQDAELGMARNRLSAYQAGFAREMHKILNGMGDTHTVSKAFLKGGRGARQGARRTLEIMMGPEDAASFMQQMERANIASTTYKNQFNSQTEPLRRAMEDENSSSKIAGMLRGMGYLTNPMRAFEDYSMRLANRMDEGRNEQIARLLSPTTSNPNEVFDVLRQLENIALNRSPIYGAERVNAYSAPALVSSSAGAFMSAQDEEERRRRLRGQ